MLFVLALRRSKEREEERKRLGWGVEVRWLVVIVVVRGGGWVRTDRNNRG